MFSAAALLRFRGLLHDSSLACSSANKRLAHQLSAIPSLDIAKHTLYDAKSRGTEIKHGFHATLPNRSRFNRH